jgi:hypothetical protein
MRSLKKVEMLTDHTNSLVPRADYQIWRPIVSCPGQLHIESQWSRTGPVRRTYQDFRGEVGEPRTAVILVLKL